MKKTTCFVMALALVLGLTQCKKEQTNSTNSTQGIRITLNVENGGSRHTVNPSTGEVSFGNGDKIYVGDGHTYIGTLTRSNGVFSGEISAPQGDKLHFYFVGTSVNPDEFNEGTTAAVSVGIGIQSSGLPVLAYNSVNYKGAGSYSCKLKNQCALVKLSLANAASTVELAGRYTTAIINFANPGITPATNYEPGKVTFFSESETEKWAILLPQVADDNATVTVDGAVFTVAIPEIERNGYVTGIQQIQNPATPVETIIDLSNLGVNYEAQDGDVLTGSLSNNVKVTIAAGAEVTLRDVTINGTNSDSYMWAGISCLGDATIILKDGTTNTVKGFFHNYPGIHIATGHTLTIQGTGSLDASSNGNGSGIGGGNGISCGHILIESGTITATGGGDAAGIGCGSGNDFLPTSCGNITISGGTVTAANNHGDSGYGAGIGSGRKSSCGNITITDGASVTATKGNHALDCIGRGEDGTCGTITIGGTVYYQNNAYVGDGATYLTQSTLVYPTPTPVEQIVDLSTITSAYTAVDGDILTGTLGTGVQISIADGATITLRSANINGSDNLSGTFHGLKCLGDATIILENNNNVVKAKCSSGGRAGIFVPQHKTLTFEAGNSSGFVAATGAGEAAGIGGYSNTHCGAIVINSGKVTGTAGTGVDGTFEDSYSAGIGSSAYRRCDGITINGGQVIGTAYEYGNAAGIGTGGNGICKKDGDSDGSQPAITISNTLSNYVKAQKGSNATYFIGGASSSDKCGIVIVGGTTYEDGDGNRGISSSTSLSYDFTVSGNSLIYMPE